MGYKETVVEDVPFVNELDGYLISPSDRAIRVTGAANAVVTLPVTGLQATKTIKVSQVLTPAGVSNLTVNAVGGPPIGNSGNDTSEALFNYGDVRTFEWDGSMWWVVDR